MKHIKLRELDVSRIGLGAMGMSSAYTDAGSDDAESIRTIHRALELGVTFLDTAEVYGPFTNEELLGRAIRGRRDQVVVATKFGMISHAGGGPGVLDSSPANIRLDRASESYRANRSANLRLLEELSEQLAQSRPGSRASHLSADNVWPLSCSEKWIDPGGAVFRNLTRLSRAGIPTLALVFGSSTAGGAYVPGLSDHTIMVRERAKVFLGGPPLVRMATGEQASDEELGGAEMHARVSGLADQLAADEHDCIRLGREAVANLGWGKLHSGEVKGTDGFGVFRM